MAANLDALRDLAEIEAITSDLSASGSNGRLSKPAREGSFYETTVVSVRKPRRPGLKDSADMWELVDETAVVNADSPRGGRKMSRPHLRPPRDDLHDSSDMTDLAALAPKAGPQKPTRTALLQSTRQPASPAAAAAFAKAARAGDDPLPEGLTFTAEVYGGSDDNEDDHDPDDLENSGGQWRYDEAAQHDPAPSPRYPSPVPAVGAASPTSPPERRPRGVVRAPDASAAPPQATTDEGSGQVDGQSPPKRRVRRKRSTKKRKSSKSNKKPVGGSRTPRPEPVAATKAATEAPVEPAPGRRRPSRDAGAAGGNRRRSRSRKRKGRTKSSSGKPRKKALRAGVSYLDAAVTEQEAVTAALGGDSGVVKPDRTSLLESMKPTADGSNPFMPDMAVETAQAEGGEDHSSAATTAAAEKRPPPRRRPANKPSPQASREDLSPADQKKRVLIAESPETADQTPKRRLPKRPTRKPSLAPRANATVVKPGRRFASSGDIFHPTEDGRLVGTRAQRESQNTSLRPLSEEAEDADVGGGGDDPPGAILGPGAAAVAAAAEAQAEADRRRRAKAKLAAVAGADSSKPAGGKKAKYRRVPTKVRARPKRKPAIAVAAVVEDTPEPVAAPAVEPGKPSPDGGSGAGGKAKARAKQARRAQAKVIDVRALHRLRWGS